MKNKLFHLQLILGSLLFLSFMTASLAQAQVIPYPIPYSNQFFYPFAYCPWLPPPLDYTNPLTAYGRYAHVPLTSTSSLFPAPTLPAVPAATPLGVGVTTLIPTVPVTVTVPASVLVTNPLAPLITFTPLSLVGLTFAPVPVVTPPLLVPAVLPTAALPTISTIASIISALLI